MLCVMCVFYVFGVCVCVCDVIVHACMCAFSFVFVNVHVCECVVCMCVHAHACTHENTCGRLFSNALILLHHFFRCMVSTFDGRPTHSFICLFH